MAIFILAEHDNHSLKATTLSTITAAAECGSDLHLLIAGHQCKAVAEQASQIGALSKILLADDVAYEHGLAENVAALMAELAADYSHILAPASTYGKNILPRLAALLEMGMLSDIIAVQENQTYLRPIYAGNAIATVQNAYDKQILTVRATAFDKASIGDGNVDIETVTAVHNTAQSSFIKHELNQSDRPELGSARVVISGGRALQSAENFQLLEQLADTLGGAIGASRAAVDAGFVPNDYQVGQTGKVVAPELYFAIGISGAIQHVAGMKDSKVIVAINKDADAPIFKIADYGLVGDLFEIVPELDKALKTVVSQ